MTATPPRKPSVAPLGRRALAELIGTAMLATVIIGSGIAAQRLSTDTGLQLLENSTATALGLAVLILLFTPVSGAHLNPVVSLADTMHCHTDTRMTVRTAGIYIVAQTLGAIGGAILANAMFATPTTISTADRATPATFLAEIVATTGLVLLITGLTRTSRTAPVIAAAIGCYIGAAYWFTSSTSFANPAVTIGRVFTDTFAGIAPTAALLFVAAQLIGMGVAVGLTVVLFPSKTARLVDGTQ